MKIDMFPYLIANETFIEIDSNEIRKSIFEKAIKKAKNQSGLSKILKISEKNLSRYKLGKRSILMSDLQKLLKFSKTDIAEISSNLKIKLGKSSKFHLPHTIEINPDWIYVAELIRCDGHLPKNQWCATFTNSNQSLINEFVNFFTVLGVPKNCIDVRTKMPHRYIKEVTIRSKSLAFIFNKVFEIPFGNKSHIIRIPKFYEKISLDLTKMAVRAAFDSEGTVQIGSKNYTTPRRIAICSASKLYLEDLQKILIKIGIYSRISEYQRGMFKIYISHRINIEKFSKEIKPLHSMQKKKIENLLKIYDKTRVPERTLRKAVLLLLKEDSKRRSEIAVNLDMKKAKLGWHLKWLLKNKLVDIEDKIYTNKGSYYVYKITKYGIEYLSDEDGPFRNQFWER
jgi:DNA-binding transcriptional ArsR family regulator